jgi:alpha-1,2-mannosyltransferase
VVAERARSTLGFGPAKDRASASVTGGTVIGGVALFVLAFGLRLGVVLASNGGAAGNFGYDPGVYYAAADALIHGRMPYTDFVLLHPPGLMLVLTPFAALGQVTTDHAGFIVANTAFEALGAVNAVLVFRVALALGLRRRAALAGGTFYALWFGAIGAEVSARLEPLGSFAFLAGLLVLRGGARQPLRTRRAVVAGLSFGAAISVKVWWIVPIAVVLAWLLSAPVSRRAATRIAMGAAAAVAVIDGPFFVAAPRLMIRMVVTDQLGRPVSTAPMKRLANLTSVHGAFPALGGPAEYVAVVALAALGVAVGVLGWRTRAARMVVLVALAQLIVLAVSPSYFGFYAGYPAAALALVIAAAAEPAAGSRSINQFVAPAVVLVAAALTTVTLVARPITVTTRFPGARLAAGVRSIRCLMADSPMALIELDALSRDLADGCPNWIDVTGRTYDVDAPRGPGSTARSANHRWQRDVLRYLLSGDAVILIRDATGLSPATRRALAAHPALDARLRYPIYLIRPR